MKKFLALVLALIMTTSLVTISAGAKDFTDDSKIKYEEAVDVMAALEIIGGYADGSFNPTGTLTRGAAAKIICGLNLTPDVATTLKATTAPYSDVPVDSTFAGYIAYCQKEGIISGYADGTFKPGAPLTNFAFLKMLLCSLGYDQNVEGFTGENWAINVAKMAKKLELTKGDDNFVGTAAATREQACLFARNTLLTQAVKYNNQNTITIGNVEISQTGTVVNDGGTFGANNFPKLHAYEDVTDAFGRPATRWTLTGYGDDGVIGIYPQVADKTYTASVKEYNVYNDLDLTSAYTFDVVTTLADGTKTETTNGIAKKSVDSTSSIGGNGVQTEVFYKVEDGVASGVIVHIYSALAEVDAVEEDADGKRYIEIDGYDDYYTEEFEKDDMVIVTAADSDDDPAIEIQSIYKVEKKTGTITKKVGDDVIYIDGVKNTLYAGVSCAQNVKDEIDYYVDANGYVMKTEAASTSVSLANLAFVENAGIDGTYDQVKKATLRLPDGTKKVVETDYDYSVEGDHYAFEKVVTYKTNKDGEYVLTPVTYGGDKQTVTAKFSSASTKIGSLDVDSKTTFVYGVEKDGKTTFTVYEGFKNAPELKATSNAMVAGYKKTSSSAASLVYVYVTSAKLESSTSNATYLFYDKSVDVVDDGDGVVYYEYSAVVDGEVKTSVKVQAGLLDAKVVPGTNSIVALKAPTYDKENVMDALGDDLDKTLAVSSIKAEKNDRICINGEYYQYADKVAVYFVDDGAFTVGAMSSIKDSAEMGGTYAYTTGVFTYKDDIVTTIVLVKK